MTGPSSPARSSTSGFTTRAISYSHFVQRRRQGLNTAYRVSSVWFFVVPCQVFTSKSTSDPSGATAVRAFS